MSKKNIIEMLRKKHNMTQTELAEKLGVSQRTISKIEIEGNAGKKTAQKLSEFFNVSTSKILLGEETVNKNQIKDLIKRLEKLQTLQGYVNQEIQDLIKILEEMS
jgi:transcriptional regulator with XRE-family HTH domain